MPTINSSLQELLNSFATTNQNASQTFTNALNASPALMDQYNTLAACGYLRGFAGTTQSGVGGVFNTNNQTFYIPLDANGNVVTGMADLVFVMGHEGQHATDFFTTMAMANQSFQTAVTTLASQAGNQDYTSLLLGMQQANNVDESTAQLAGWNAYVDYMHTTHGPNVTFDTLLQYSGYRDYFNDPSLTFNPDLSITATTANVAAEGNIYFFNPNANLGSQGDLTYPNWYGGYNVGLICSATHGDNITIDFAALNYDPNSIREVFSIANFYQGICTVNDPSSNSKLIFNNTGSGTTLDVSNQTSLVDSTEWNSKTYDTNGVLTQTTKLTVGTDGSTNYTWQNADGQGSAAYANGNHIDTVTDANGNSVVSYINADGTTGGATYNVLDGSQSTYSLSADGHGTVAYYEAGGSVPTSTVTYDLAPDTATSPDFTWNNGDGTRGSAVFDNGYMLTTLYKSDNSYSCFLSEANGVSGLQSFNPSGAPIGDPIFTGATNSDPWVPLPGGTFTNPTGGTTSGQHKKQAVNDAVFEMGRVA